MSSTEFSDKTCSAPAARSARMRDIVLEYVPRDRAVAVLDLGCGTGALAFLLADAVPAARIAGVDISAANIRAAEKARAVLDPLKAGRLAFEQADYLARPAAPVDVLVTDGVLHLIPGNTNDLFAKLASDVRAGGFLIAAMPYDCGYNYAFATLRRLLRLVRSPALDALILRIGRVLHGREMDDAGLRERIPYMYIAPQRLAGRSLRDTIAPSVGLRLIARHAMPSVSLSQLKHEVLVFEKAA